MKKLTTNRYALGRHYEHQAKQFLQKQGLAFVAENVRIRGGEIDLIMRDKHTWVFVEVRFRQNSQYGGAIATITKNKRKKLLHTAAVWLYQRNECLETASCRFDVCAITGQKFEWLKNAFTLNENLFQ
ncbi:YraN family protein [Xenorhabdus khoisanae]|uniref:YraN family protein n=1 Tax=Xenorhabdus khoisanae TaxID=880157 RepID=UPI002359BA2B|nr:YraN family protein [Xenorhabdus khoisanae]MDC9615033.1 YraN family protein [Xenorhabdus khoisanae]